MTKDEQDEIDLCNSILARLRREYQETAKPFVDRIVAIEARQPPKPVILCQHLRHPGECGQCLAGSSELRSISNAD